MKLPSKQQAANIAARLWNVLKIRFNSSPISSVEELVDFVQTRAAYIAQTSLYGYLKTRMGIRYPKVFEDEAFSKSIDVAKWNVYAACLADLSIFAAATAAAGTDRDAAARELARRCFDTALDNTFGGTDLHDIQERARDAFAQRLDRVNWPNAAIGETAFTDSPEEFVRWAPIADELKQFDREIVVNSIRFRWRDVREQLRRRADGPALIADIEDRMTA